MIIVKCYHQSYQVFLIDLSIIRFSHHSMLQLIDASSSGMLQLTEASSSSMLLSQTDLSEFD